jgi:hypothetical protein
VILVRAQKLRRPGNQSQREMEIVLEIGEKANQQLHSKLEASLRCRARSCLKAKQNLTIRTIGKILSGYPKSI